MTGKKIHETIGLETYTLVMDVNLDIYAELDKRTISFRELVNLNIDSLLPLDRPSGENIDIYAGGVLLGSGEILVIEGSLAVRIADLRDKPSPLEHSQPSAVDERAA